MQFSTIIALLSATAIAAAAPGGYPGHGGDKPGNGGGQKCGNGQVESCCNTGVSILPILGGACTLPILGQGCSGNQAFCCDAHQNGLINIGSICLPITL